MDTANDPHKVSSLFEIQMTHFPALAPETNENEINPKQQQSNINSSGGILSSVKSFFRSSSNTNSTNNNNVNVISPDSELYLEDIESDSSTITYNTIEEECEKILQQNDSLSTSIISANESSTQSANKVEKKLSIRIPSMFRSGPPSGNESDQRPVDSLIKYKESEFRRYWMPDSTGKECYECYEKFNAFRRRHHCRLCGQIFCGKCSNRQINGPELGYAGVLRLCNFCANKVEAVIRERRNNENFLIENSQSYSLLYPSVDLNNTYSAQVNRISSLNTSKTNDTLFIKPKVEFNELNAKATVNDTDHLNSINIGPSCSTENNYLEQMFEKNIELMLDCLLLRENLDKNLWKGLLLRLSHKVISLVIDKILKINDALNVLDFVHIKKLNTSNKPNFDIFEGVTFTKTLVHSAMLSKAKSVSIMLLAGNISYERVVEKLSSLETIMLQEQDYLKIQVDRIVSRRVTLLLVENFVAKLASDMLLAEGISLVTNVKHKILQRIARATNAELITSLDAQFLQPRTGFFLDFEQREYTLLDNSRKKIIVLDNCMGNEYGVSVNLYGPTLKELIAAKRILKFLLVARYSSSLEIAFLALFNSSPGKMLKDVTDFQELSIETENETDLNETLTENNIHPLYVDSKQNETNLNVTEENSSMKTLMNKKFDCEICNFNQICEAKTDTNPTKFIKLLRETQLTNSPAIRFAPPYLETEQGQSCFILSYFKNPLYPFLTQQDLINLRTSDEELQADLLEVVNECKNLQNDNENLRHLMLVGDSIDSKIFLNQSRWARFRVQSSLIFRRRYELNRFCEEKKAIKLNNILQLRKENESKILNAQVNVNSDILSPYNCQRIAFLYCANARKVSQNTKTFCMGPYVLLRQFFFGQESGYKDTSLGVFLANYCFNPDYKCTNCDRSMMDHLRRIVHRNARIEITTYDLQRNGNAVSSTMYDEFSVDDLPSSIPNNNCSLIICWRRCQKCLVNSCIMPLSDAVYHLSFAKFVDYLANGTYWVSPFPTKNLNETCQHCTFHEHLHFFAYYNFVTCFRIRPLHVIFNPMICRICSENVLCSNLIENNYDLNSTASELFDRALSFFKDFKNEQNALQNNVHIQLSQPAELLLSFVEQFKLKFRSHISKFDPDGIFKRSKVVDSSEDYYVQSESCLMRCRYLLNSFITKWNSTKLDSIFISVPPNITTVSFNKTNNFDDRHSVNRLSINSNNSKIIFEESNINLLSLGSDILTAVTSGSSRTPSVNSLNNLNSSVYLNYNESNSIGLSFNSNINTTTAESSLSNVNSIAKSLEIPRSTIPFELPTLINPLPKNLHFELPINNLTILIRDIIEGKNFITDIGSVIAYTLASDEFDEQKTIRESDNNYNEFIFGSDIKSKYNVKIYFPEEFEKLRSLIFGHGKDQYIRSISRSTAWHPQGGKSGANFFRTEDERFVIKQILRLEMESFKKCAQNYFDYVTTAFEKKKLTSLCKIYGVYGLNVTGKHQQNIKIHVLVMEYLFYGKNVKQIWDLKGSLRNRYASTKREAQVLLDENLVQDLWGNQLYVHPYSKTALNQAITNDCHFLSNQGIMDYSLLAGICSESDEVVIGIVDYMRTFTLDKKVESLVKTALPIAHSPTVVSPELYCKRFYDAIDGYFVVAPDQWTYSDNVILKQNN